MARSLWKSSLSILLAIYVACLATETAAKADPFRLATFKTDVTIPLGHRCMGILPRKAERVVDPLYAHGFVLLGPDKPIVLVAVDWCEIRNASYDRWRDALAEAAGTDRQRVIVCSVHQHDAPVVDGGAQQLLASVSLPGELFDTRFHKDAVRRTAAALRDSLDGARPVTHLGLGKTRVEKIASSRRVVHPDGRVSFSRYSSSGGDPFHRGAPDGDIDRWLKSISFYDGRQPLATLSVYATHPMSYYGRGEVSADFVGIARDRRQRDDFQVAQIYASGASGDVTAGKYNDGSTANRPVLAERLYRAMKAASETAERVPLERVDFRVTALNLEFHDGVEFTESALTETLHDGSADVSDRILAAMGLSSRQRIASGQAIDVPCIDFGPAQIVLLPGEAFVGYQLMAQQMRPDSLVVCIGFGECWPGYIPTRAAFEERFDHGWRWVAPGAEEQIRAALGRVLLPGE